MPKIVYTILVVMTYIMLNPVWAQYDMNTPVEGNSIANNTLQFNLIKDLYKKLSVSNPVCYDYRIKNTQLIHYPYDVKMKNDKYVSGYWKELWTIDMCGSFVQIPVTFFINENNTTFKTDENSLLR